MLLESRNNYCLANSVMPHALVVALVFASKMSIRKVFKGQASILSPGRKSLRKDPNGDQPSQKEQRGTKLTSEQTGMRNGIVVRTPRVSQAWTISAGTVVVNADPELGFTAMKEVAGLSITDSPAHLLPVVSITVQLNCKSRALYATRMGVIQPKIP